MGGIVEHGAGVAGGAQALAGTLQGAAQGMQLGAELAQRKTYIDQQRQQMRLVREAADLERSQQQAQTEWDTLIAQAMGQEQGPAADGQARPPLLAAQNGPPPPLKEFDQGQTDIPGVRRAPMGFSREELGILARMSPEARSGAIQRKEREIMAANFEANLQSLRGRVGMMGQRMGPYAPQDGTLPDPRLESVIQQADSAVALYEAGEITGAQAHAAVSKASDAILEAAWQQQDAIETGQALYGKLADVRQGFDPLAGGDTGEIEYQEWIIKSWANGQLDGPTARALSGLGQQGSNAVLSWAQQQLLAATPAPGTREAAGQLQVNRIGAAPSGASFPGASSPEGAPAPANVEGDAPAPPQAVPAADRPAPPAAASLPEEGGRHSPIFTQTFKGREKARMEDKLREMGKALKAGDEARVEKLAEGLTKNQAERNALAEAAANVSAGADPAQELRKLRKALTKRAQYEAKAKHPASALGEQPRAYDLQGNPQFGPRPVGADPVRDLQGRPLEPKGERADLERKKKTKE